MKCGCENEYCDHSGTQDPGDLTMKHPYTRCGREVVRHMAFVGGACEECCRRMIDTGGPQWVGELLEEREKMTETTETQEEVRDLLLARITSHLVQMAGESWDSLSTLHTLLEHGLLQDGEEYADRGVWMDVQVMDMFGLIHDMPEVVQDLKDQVAPMISEWERMRGSSSRREK